MPVIGHCLVHAGPLSLPPPPPSRPKILGTAIIPPPSLKIRIRYSRSCGPNALPRQASLTFTFMRVYAFWSPYTLRQRSLFRELPSSTSYHSAVAFFLRLPNLIISSSHSRFPLSNLQTAHSIPLLILCFRSTFLFKPSRNPQTRHLG